MIYYFIFKIKSLLRSLIWSLPGTFDYYYKKLEFYIAINGPYAHLDNLMYDFFTLKIYSFKNNFFEQVKFTIFKAIELSLEFFNYDLPKFILEFLFTYCFFLYSLFFYFKSYSKYTFSKILFFNKKIILVLKPYFGVKLLFFSKIWFLLIFILVFILILIYFSRQEGYIKLIDFELYNSPSINFVFELYFKLFFFSNLDYDKPLHYYFPSYSFFKRLVLNKFNNYLLNILENFRIWYIIEFFVKNLYILNFELKQLFLFGIFNMLNEKFLKYYRKNLNRIKINFFDNILNSLPESMIFSHTILKLIIFVFFTLFKKVINFISNFFKNLFSFLGFEFKIPILSFFEVNIFSRYSNLKYLPKFFTVIRSQLYERNFSQISGKIDFPYKKFDYTLGEGSDNNFLNKDISLEIKNYYLNYKNINLVNPLFPDRELYKNQIWPNIKFIPRQNQLGKLISDIPVRSEFFYKNADIKDNFKEKWGFKLEDFTNIEKIYSSSLARDLNNVTWIDTFVEQYLSSRDYFYYPNWKKILTSKNERIDGSQTLRPIFFDRYGNIFDMYLRNSFRTGNEPRDFPVRTRQDNRFLRRLGDFYLSANSKFFNNKGKYISYPFEVNPFTYYTTTKYSPVTHFFNLLLIGGRIERDPVNDFMRYRWYPLYEFFEHLLFEEYGDFLVRSVTIYPYFNSKRKPIFSRRHVSNYLTVRQSGLLPSLNFGLTNFFLFKLQKYGNPFQTFWFYISYRFSFVFFYKKVSHYRRFFDFIDYKAIFYNKFMRRWLFSYKRGIFTYLNLRLQRYLGFLSVYDELNPFFKRRFSTKYIIHKVKDKDNNHTTVYYYYPKRWDRYKTKSGFVYYKKVEPHYILKISFFRSVLIFFKLLINFRFVDLFHYIFKRSYKYKSDFSYQVLHKDNYFLRKTKKFPIYSLSRFIIFDLIFLVFSFIALPFIFLIYFYITIFVLFIDSLITFFKKK